METLTEESMETITEKTIETIEKTLNCQKFDFAYNSDTLPLVHMQKHKANRVFFM